MKFEKEDETKRYIAELKAETDRLKMLNDDNGVEDIDNDDEGVDKLEKELGIKNRALDQDMAKHNDVMSRKDQELSIKRTQANKPKA